MNSDEWVEDPVARALVAAAREEFPPESIGKLPRIWCKDCQKRQCNQHTVSQCQVCGNRITEAHVDLDYVGHANVTARLQSIDPDWSWEPMALDDSGLPLIVSWGDMSVMWINLTIRDRTRQGVGTVQTRKQEGVKELIGDAIRNGAMRFGVALDLWAKEDLVGELGGEDERSPLATKEQKEEIGMALLEIANDEERSRCAEEIRSIWGQAAGLLASEVSTVVKFIRVFEHLRPSPRGEDDPSHLPPESAVSEPTSDGDSPGGDQAADLPETDEGASEGHTVGDEVKANAVAALASLDVTKSREAQQALEDADLWPIKDVPGGRLYDLQHVLEDFR